MSIKIFEGSIQLAGDTNANLVANDPDVKPRQGIIDLTNGTWRVNLDPVNTVSWSTLTDFNTTAGGGDVVGPGSATDNAVAIYDSTTGKLISNSLVIITAGAVTGVTTLNMSGILTALGGTSTDWNTAFSWGDHSIAGYLTAFTDIDTDYGNETVTSDWVFQGNGATGSLLAADLIIGNGGLFTPGQYGALSIGSSWIGKTSFNSGSLDLDGTLVIWNTFDPPTSKMEFAFLEGGTNQIRFALATSGVGNATYNARSMLIAGPAVFDDTIVTVGYWQSQGIFDNLVCDTSGDGADLGVQNDLEVEGDIFTDSIKESTTAAGVTIDSVLLKDGLVDGIDVATDVAANTAKLTCNTANVDAAGATMNTDADLSSNTYFLDEDTMSSDSAVKVASQQSIKAYVDTEVTNKPESFIIACSGTTEVLTTGTAKETFRMPYAFTVTEVRASLTTAGTGAALVTVDINEGGVSILRTKITIDATEKTSTTAATAAVISDSALDDDAEITIDIDQIDTGGVSAGLKVYIIGHQ